MGIEFCPTGLDLGLGISSSPVELKSRKSATGDSPPVLTLSLSDDRRRKADFEHVYGQDSAGSSLSSVKRERETEEAEIERVSSRVSDEDDDGSNGRKKLRLSKAQSALLEESFKHQSTLNPKQKQDLARELKLRPRQVEVWFQNRRARTKLKQTEIDREFLKNCCDSLTDENRRLQKELQELKSLNLTQPPLYMQLPAATLTMCPSCERLGVPAAENAAMDPKTHMYSGFTNQSAAC